MFNGNGCRPTEHACRTAHKVSSFLLDVVCLSRENGLLGGRSMLPVSPEKSLGPRENIKRLGLSDASTFLYRQDHSEKQSNIQRDYFSRFIWFYKLCVNSL